MNQSPIRGRTVAILVGICALAMLALAVLYAFAPELRGNDSDEANALSRSAVGFAGLVELLNDSGIATRIDRYGHSDQATSLIILTPSGELDGRELATYRAGGPVLIILDKWLVVPLPLHSGWVVKGDSLPSTILEKQLARAAVKTRVLRTRTVVRNIGVTPGPAAPPGLGIQRLGNIDQLQALMGGPEPVLSMGSITLLSRLGPSATPSELMSRLTRPASRITPKSYPVYILSDPDVMNNHGLSDPNKARAAVAIVAALRAGNGPVAFDITLNGLGKSPNLFRAAFAPPFLGATLCALFAALLMGLHTAFRFGAPQVVPRIFARGKKALADNSAALVRMMGREGAMAPRYVAAARTLVLDAVSARRASPAQQQALLDTLSRGGETYEELAAEAAGAKNGNDLLGVARKTFDWRRRISGGH